LHSTSWIPVPWNSTGKLQGAQALRVKHVSDHMHMGVLSKFGRMGLISGPRGGGGGKQ
jgi:hypothetical protein